MGAFLPRQVAVVARAAHPPRLGRYPGELHMGGLGVCSTQGEDPLLRLYPVCHVREGPHPRLQPLRPECNIFIEPANDLQLPVMEEPEGVRVAGDPRGAARHVGDRGVLDVRRNFLGVVDDKHASLGKETIHDIPNPFHFGGIIFIRRMEFAEDVDDDQGRVRLPERVPYKGLRARDTDIKRPRGILGMSHHDGAPEVHARLPEIVQAVAPHGFTSVELDVEHRSRHRPLPEEREPLGHAQRHVEREETLSGLGRPQQQGQARPREQLMNDPVEPRSGEIRVGREGDETHARGMSNGAGKMGHLALPKTDQEHLSVADLAALIGVSPWLVRRLIRYEGLPAYRAGKRLIILRSEFNAWLRQHRERPTSLLADLAAFDKNTGQR